MAVLPDPPGPPLTEPQQRVLAALVALSPAAGGDVSAREVAERSGVRLASVTLVLRSLAAKRLALCHEAESDEDEDAWAPTLTGRARVRPADGAAAPPSDDEDEDRWPAHAVGEAAWPPAGAEL